MQKDNKNARKWYKHVIKERVQFTIDSWEECDLQVNSESAKVRNLKKRIQEHDENREKLGQTSVERLDEILKAMDKCSKKQLEIKMKIFRNEIKKEKKNKKAEESEQARERQS